MNQFLSVGLPAGVEELLTMVLVTLLVAATAPLISSLLRIRIIPTFIFEIIAGVILGPHFIGLMKGQDMLEVLQIVGLVFIIFLSGLDIDFDVIKKDKEYTKFKIVKVVLILFTGVIALGYIASALLLHLGYFHGAASLPLGTILFSATFAGVVVPMLHKNHLTDSLIGQIVATFALVSEAFSLIALSIFMVVSNITHTSITPIAAMIGVTAIVIVLFKYVRPRVNISDIETGMVYIGMRWTIVLLIALLAFAHYSGGEYILGAFLCGAVIKFLRPTHDFEESLKQLGFGLFIPFYFVIMGSKIDINLFTDWNFIGLSLFVALLLILTKLPLMFLFKWFKFSVVVPSMVLLSSTVVVSFTVAEFGHALHIITDEFQQAIIVGSIFVLLLAPIMFEIFFPVKKTHSEDSVYKDFKAKNEIDGKSHSHH